MRAKTTSSNLLLHDIEDQPQGRYILLVENILGSKGAISVDKAVANERGLTHFYRRTKTGEYIHEQEVCVLPTHMQWVMVERPVMQRVTLEELCQRSAQDKKDMKALEETYFPPEEGEVTMPTVGGGAKVVLLDGGKADLEGYGNYL